MYVTSKHIQELIARDDNTKKKLSIYLPTHPSSNGPTITQDTARFKNALKEIRNSSKYDERELGAVMKTLLTLVDDIEFWRHQTEGLALFADSDGYEYYHLSNETTDATYIEKRFIVSPLVLMQSLEIDFYVLDINMTKPRLLQSSNGTLEEILLDRMPGSFEETAEREEYQTQRQNMAAPRGSTADNRIHGHGPEDALQHDINLYATFITKAVDEYLEGDNLPLLLVGEESRVGNLRPHLKYSSLLPQSVDGNFESATPQVLYNAVIGAVKAYASTYLDTLVHKFMSSPPALVVMGLDEITEAASRGRVERMYVPAYRRTTDSVRPGNSESTVLQISVDIAAIESVIRSVLAQSGEVQAVEVGAYPELNEPRALCRY